MTDPPVSLTANTQPYAFYNSSNGNIWAGSATQNSFSQNIGCLLVGGSPRVPVAAVDIVGSSTVAALNIADSQISTTFTSIIGATSTGRMITIGRNFIITNAGTAAGFSISHGLGTASLRVQGTAQTSSGSIALNNACMVTINVINASTITGWCVSPTTISALGGSSVAFSPLATTVFLSVYLA